MVFQPNGEAPKILQSLQWNINETSMKAIWTILWKKCSGCRTSRKPHQCFLSVSPDEQCQAPLLKSMADRHRHKGTSNDFPKQLEATVTTQSGWVSELTTATPRWFSCSLIMSKVMVYHHFSWPLGARLHADWFAKRRSWGPGAEMIRRASSIEGDREGTLEQKNAKLTWLMTWHPGCS